MRSLLLLSFFWLCGCRGEGSSPNAADLALPVTAPVQARDRLLRDLRQQKATAEARRGEFEQATGTNGR